jgi:hypothetical protein
LETVNFRFARKSNLPTLMALVNEAFQVERFFLIGNDSIPKVRANISKKATFCSPKKGARLLDAFMLRCMATAAISDFYQSIQRGRNAALTVNWSRRWRSSPHEIRVHHMDLTVVNLRRELLLFYEKLGYTVTGTQPTREDLARRVNQPCHLIRMFDPYR